MRQICNGNLRQHVAERRSWLACGRTDIFQRRNRPVMGINALGSAGGAANQMHRPLRQSPGGAGGFYE